jgi:hypothetical protein
MSKKDFSATFESLTATTEKKERAERRTADPEKEQEARAALATQGKKGYKLQRINMAFTPDNIDYLRLVSKAKGLTMTQFVNEIIDRERERNSDILEQLKAVTDKL